MRAVVEIVRVVAALLAAAAAAAAVLVLGAAVIIWGDGDDALGPAIESAASLWWFAFVGALAHAVILGLPAYLVLRWLGWTRWWMSPICGYAIGCLPSAFYFTNGVSTLASWLDYAQGVGKIGFLGMAGGVAAWLTWHWLGRALTRPATATD